MGIIHIALMSNSALVCIKAIVAGASACLTIQYSNSLISYRFVKILRFSKCQYNSIFLGPRVCDKRHLYITWNLYIDGWELEGCYCYSVATHLRTRRALKLYKVHGVSALLVLKGDRVNTLEVISWRYLPALKLLFTFQIKNTEHCIQHVFKVLNSHE